MAKFAAGVKKALVKAKTTSSPDTVQAIVPATITHRPANNQQTPNQLPSNQLHRQKHTSNQSTINPLPFQAALPAKSKASGTTGPKSPKASASLAVVPVQETAPTGDRNKNSQRQVSKTEHKRFSDAVKNSHLAMKLCSLTPSSTGT